MDPGNMLSDEHKNQIHPLVGGEVSSKPEQAIFFIWGDLCQIQLMWCPN